MKIRALRLYNVGRFEGRGIAIENIADGVNVLCAANESGKSTSFEALHALFFLPHSSLRKEVQRLRPYSGGNPLIEVDITTRGGEFRLSKQYYGRNFAKVEDLRQQKLLAQADEAENFIANLIEDRGRPAGLLWVRQGVNALEKHGSSQATGEYEARVGLLQSVQGEIDAVTGGRRMDMIMERVQAELDSLITTKGAKAGGRYAIAVEAVEHLSLEEQRLSAEVHALRQALDMRTKLQKQLAECDNEQAHAERRRDIDAAQKAFDAAKLQNEKIKSAQAQLELAQLHHQRAKQDWDDFNTAQTKQATLQQQYQQLLPQRETIIAKRGASQAALDTLRAASKKAYLKREQYHKQGRQRQAAVQLAQLQQQICQASELTETIKQAELARACLKITPEIWQELQNLDIEIARLQAISSAKHPSFTIHYQDDNAERIRLNGAAITEGQTHSYREEARLEIPHLATIILQAHLAIEADKELHKVQEKYRQYLAQFNIQSLAQAQDALNQARDLDSQLTGLHLSLAKIAPQGLTALQGSQAELQAFLEGYEPVAETLQEPAQFDILLTQADERYDQAQLDLQNIQTQRLQQEQEFAEIEGQLAVYQAQLVHLQTITGGEQSQIQRQRHLAQQVETTATELALAVEHVQALQVNKIDMDVAQIRLQRLQSAEAAIEQESCQLRETLAGLNAAIATHADQAVEEKWFETKEKLEAARTRLEAEKIQLAALQRLSNALTKARAQARDLYLMPIMRELIPLIKLIFDDLVLHFDDKTLLPQRISRSGQEEEVERLSGGMREQISILTRLAFARLLAHSGYEVPVILDDALVYCDDDRIEKMFDILHAQASEQQIIVFSCRSRAFSRLGGTILHMRDWQP